MWMMRTDMNRGFLIIAGLGMIGTNSITYRTSLVLRRCGVSGQRSRPIRFFLVSCFAGLMSLIP